MTNPAALLINLNKYDQRICFAYNLSNKKFIYTNPAFESFFQISARKISIKKLFAMVSPDDKNYLKQTFMALQTGVFKNNVEFKMTLSDGKDYFLRLSVLSQTDENQEEILTGYIENISNYKAYCQQLTQFADNKKAVLNTISHDLTAPLGSIQNLAALTVRKAKSIEDQEVKKWVSLIEEISKKSVRMIQTFVRKEFVELAGSNLDQH